MSDIQTLRRIVPQQNRRIFAAENETHHLCKHSPYQALAVFGGEKTTLLMAITPISLRPYDKTIIHTPWRIG
ncbi:MULTISPECIES: hypothetical protein [Pseudomonas]|uniref:Uncharacterized protein n=1 Tax=Pseudomonas kulmbachensis TaxID=3043408 RepID=A0ABW7M2K1_9PSED|nr:MULTISPECIES: hypothetical protein [Pseudomonas]UXL39726.1 hypothetical protein N7D90_06060 [Pseudomonas fragi]